MTQSLNVLKKAILVCHLGDYMVVKLKLIYFKQMYVAPWEEENNFNLNSRRSGQTLGLIFNGESDKSIK